MMELTIKIIYYLFVGMLLGKLTSWQLQMFKEFNSGLWANIETWFTVYRISEGGEMRPDWAWGD